MPSSSGFSQSRNWTWVSCTTGTVFTVWDTGKPIYMYMYMYMHVDGYASKLGYVWSNICYYQFEYVWSYVYVQYTYMYICMSLVAQMLESSCDAGEPGSIPRLGRSPGGGHGNPSSFLAWRIPWREEPGRPHMGLQRVEHDWATNTHWFIYIYI